MSNPKGIVRWKLWACSVDIALLPFPHRVRLPFLEIRFKGLILIAVQLADISPNVKLRLISVAFQLRISILAW